MHIAPRDSAAIKDTRTVQQSSYPYFGDAEVCSRPAALWARGATEADIRGCAPSPGTLCLDPVLERQCTLVIFGPKVVLPT